MRKYEIASGRERIILESYSACACEIPPQGGQMTAGVVISPSFSSDFYLCAIGDGGRISKARPTHLFALGFYLHTVCGMPFAPISIETPQGVIDTEFCYTGSGAMGIIMDECKQYYTSVLPLPCGVRAEIISARYRGGCYRLMRTKNPLQVTEGLLTELKILRGLPDCLGSVAISPKDGSAVGGSTLDSFTAAAIIAPLCDGWETGGVCVKYFDSEFMVERTAFGRVAVAPRSTEYTRIK